MHATTATQKTVDGPSKKDWRGGRGALSLPQPVHAPAVAHTTCRALLCFAAVMFEVARGARLCTSRATSLPSSASHTAHPLVRLGPLMCRCCPEHHPLLHRRGQGCGRGAAPPERSVK